MKETGKSVIQVIICMAILVRAAFAMANEAAAPALTAEQALAMLMAGNAHYAQGAFGQCVQNSSAKTRESVAAKQHPYAIVLSCSDSRVPPEILFDKGLGEIFVIRVAGNVVAPHELGSIEYAVEHIGSPLIMVLGHERCGAVTATVEANGKAMDGNIGSLLASIAPAVEAAKATGATGPALIEAACAINIENVMAELQAKSPLIAEAVHAGRVKIVGAKYDLDSGRVELLNAPSRH